MSSASSTTERAPSGVLRGLRVLALTRDIAGSAAGMLLADYGASVVEIDLGAKRRAVDLAVAHKIWSRGKARVRLPAAGDARRDRVRALAERADLLLTDFDQESLADLALRYEDVEGDHPQLVYISITGFGLGDARSGEPGLEPVVGATLGMPWSQGGTREGPRYPAYPAGSYAAAFLAVAGAMAALWQRRRTGLGQLVDTSIYDGLLASTYNWGYGDRLPPRENLSLGKRRLITGPYPCADGEYVWFVTAARGAFGRLMELLTFTDRVPVVETSELSEQNLPLEEEEAAFLQEALPKALMQKSADEWFALLRAANIPCMRVYPPGVALTHPQVEANGLSADLDVEGVGTLRVTGLPIHFSETPGRIGPVAGAPLELRGDADVEALWSRRRPAAQPSPPSAAGATSPPLDGVHILDLGLYVAGPYTARLLAGLGADVIKVEYPLGDPLRHLGRFFNVCNKGKRSITLDLKRPQAREVVERLVGWADVVHQNMRPGVAEKLGIGYEHARVIKPEIIYVQSTAFGTEGPLVDIGGFEPLSSMFLGLGLRSAAAGNPPVYPVANQDPLNAMMAAAAIGMALNYRAATGKGQFLACPQLGSGLFSMSETAIQPDGAVLDPFVLDPEQYGFGWWNRLYRSADGWIVIACASDEERAALRRWAGLDANGDLRAHDRGSAIDEPRIAERLEALAAADAVAALRALGVSCGVVGPPHDDATFFFNEDDERMGRIAVYEHPTFGNMRDLAHFVRFSRSQLPDVPGSPSLGEHSREILASLGFDGAAIERLLGEAAGAPAR